MTTLEMDGILGGTLPLGTVAFSLKVCLYCEAYVRKHVNLLLVYTRIAPRGPPSYPPMNSFPPTEVKQEPAQAPTTVKLPSPTVESRMSIPKPDVDRTPQASRHTSASEIPNNTQDAISVSRTEDPVIPNEASNPPPISISAATPPLPNTLGLTSAAKSHGQGNDSPVMNETLSVIDEHITDMNSPHHSVATERRGTTNDSGSEYSSNLDHRLSYINGEETDEEEEAQAYQTREEVMTWNSDQVAEYLFTAGVESKHCEVFRDQEITGDVLLGMDQTSVFLKEFELGSVGRRLKTWQKIKTLQDEVKEGTPSRRNTATYGSEIGSDDARRHRSRSEASTSILPRIPSVREPPNTRDFRESSRLPQQQSPSLGSAPISAPVTRSDTIKASPVSPRSVTEGTRPVGENRPSAASIRDMQHSRQSSLVDYMAGAYSSMTSGMSGSSPPPKVKEQHKKTPSFDRNWTMGSAATPPGSTPLPSRPISSSGLQGLVRGSTDPLTKSLAANASPDTLDRGYFSGGEAEGRQRNVLRKRTISGAHSRNSSYTDEQRVRSATAHSRHSRFGSVDSIHSATPPSAAQKYYGLSVGGSGAIAGRRRTPSESSINTPPRPAPPPKDSPSPITSPTVTKLDGSSYNASTSPKLPLKASSQGSDRFFTSKSSASRHFGLRAISDAVTGHEKSRATPADALPSPGKESPLPSPSTRTGSSTPSGGPSLDLDANESKTAMNPQPANTRKKSKKETSAYTRGLEKKTPQEQMVGADYSGWMKKKSSNLMTTWKPRLFVLKGRRLSYYYSEDDDQEKGLIDISFHRVLPADNDRLTGLHATLTGATNSPTSPIGPHTETIASKQAAAEPESTLSKGKEDQMFIFKLVPPRAGLSRAVTFTKPTVHYFAVPNIKQGRLWMAALMKATIDRDDSKPITTTYQQKTISLAKARMMRHRPPALMNLDEHVDEEALKTPASDKNGLNIQGIVYDREGNEDDSGVSGVGKGDGSQSAGISSLNGQTDLLAATEPKTE